MFRTPGGYHEYSLGYREYTGGCSVHWGFSVHRGDIVSTPGAYHDECGGYHEYTGGCSVHQGDTMSIPGVCHEYTGGCHDECGGYHECSGVFSTPGVIMSTLGDTKMHVGVIMSTPRGVQYTGGIP